MDNPVVFVRSINLRSALRATSFSGRNSEPTMIRIGSGKMTYKTSVSFRGRELETNISLKSPTKDKESKIHVKSVSFKDEKSGIQSPTSPNNLLTPLSDPVRIAPSPLSEPEIQRIEAAIWLQKVYKSFRTRRRLADCAVLAEQRWWKVLDFAELKQSSVSFFEIKKPQTATTRWTRATTKAAKVGKGLSKAERARKLALQHWLEAIDPRHRYGHNLQYYYVSWLHCNSRQPFFFWLDIGDGREVNLERCPRSKLHQQCIKYLDPIERSAYEVVVSNGKLVYKMSGKVIDTTVGPKDVKWIFVLSTSKNLYVGQKSKGKFQHSSFLAGGATLSAGRLEAENGILKAIWPHSGHYLPTEENFQEFMAFLLENNVDLANVKRSSSDEGEFSSVAPPEKNKDSDEGMHSKLAKLEIPKRGDVVDDVEREGLPRTPRCSTKPRDFVSQYYYQSDDDSSSSDEDDDGTVEDSPFLTLQKLNLFDEDQEEDEKPIPKEQILQRIDSHNGRNSYQLAHQLTCKWSTGAGPRIGCIKDYPSELRMRILEEACLYPRLKVISRSPSVVALRPPKHPQHRRVTTMI